ncbi:hypothetical protein ACTGXI_10970, partial [Streptococcus suis]
MNDQKAVERGYRRIAVEEAYAPTEMLDLYRRLLDTGAVNDRGFESLMGFYLRSDAAKPVAV